jgi:hypothetical protein
LNPKKYIICNFLGHSPQLLPGKTYYSVDGTPIKITWGSDGLKRVNGIEFVQTDLITKNGVLHLIKKVCSPAFLGWRLLTDGSRSNGKQVDDMWTKKHEL